MKRRLAIGLLALLVCAAFLPFRAMAAADTRVIIDFHTTEEATPISGADFRAYRVVVREGTAFVWTADFENCGLSLAPFANWDTDELPELAGELAAYVEEHPELTPWAEGTTDSDGKLTLGELTDGAYLVVGDPVTVDDKIYTPESFMVVLPSFEGEVQKTEVTVNPKYTVADVPEPPPVDPPPDEPPPDEPPSPDGPKLPQTGQVWWPVPLLIGIGAPLFVSGMIMRKPEANDDE